MLDERILMGAQRNLIMRNDASVSERANGRTKMSTMITLKNGRRAHRECVKKHNSTIQCGLEHGSCHDPECCLSIPAPAPVFWHPEKYWLWRDGRASSHVRTT